jgi:hypothetical protein
MHKGYAAGGAVKPKKKGYAAGGMADKAGRAMKSTDADKAGRAMKKPVKMQMGGMAPAVDPRFNPRMGAMPARMKKGGVTGGMTKKGGT